MALKRFLPFGVMSLAPEAVCFAFQSPPIRNRVFKDLKKVVYSSEVQLRKTFDSGGRKLKETSLNLMRNALVKVF